MINLSNKKNRYDFIVVGAGAAGSVLAAELSASGAEVLVIESGGPDDAPTIANPNIWFYNVGGPLDYHLPVNPSPRFNYRPFNMALRLASDKFHDVSVIDGNHLGTDRDFEAILKAIEAARELGNQKVFDSVREEELIPGPNARSDDIREFARLASASFGHPVGTCKMGVDTLAVVDPQLRVHGLQGLRVADASVMPRIITGPTNAPTHMIASRASKLFLGRDT
jgi:choline dehydrogenase-like flavoprotein